MASEPPQSPLARGVIEYLQGSADHPFATVTQWWVEGGSDILEIDVEPQLSQLRHVAIKSHETIRIKFDNEDQKEPRIYAVRDDFPYDLVHTNYDLEDHGRCLCVWEEPWADLSRTLTPQQLIERIRDWLARTARGELHAPGQPVEPLIPQVPNTLVIPAGMPAGPWHVHGARRDARRTIVWLDTTPSETPGSASFGVFPLELPAQVQGALHNRPLTLSELTQLVAQFGFDFVSTLKTWLREPEQLARASVTHVIFLIAIPRMTAPDVAPEAIELWAFSPAETLAELGVLLGATVTDMVNGTAQTVPLLVQAAADAVEVPVMGLDSWRVVQRLDRATARRYAAIPRTESTKLVAVGAGAIGSNIILNTHRTGVGTWTIIDEDIVLPHNTVRQVQGDMAVGWPKAEALNVEANSQITEGGNRFIQADVLRPGEHQEAIDQAIQGADITFDFSASPAVVGYLADHEQVSRAASLFFNPDGTDLVLLAEDHDRTVKLDEVEAQYFWAAATDEGLKDHFSAARVDRIRYANACQDLTRPLPPWRVQTLSAIASGQVIQLLDTEGPTAAAWRLDPATAGVTHLPFKVAPFYSLSGTFTVRLSRQAVDQMRHHRQQAAPNETGGILIGTFDRVRKVMHVVGAFAAPDDSVQEPTYFVRGAIALQPLVDQLASRSAGRLLYVGEWHSHPDGSAASPSGDDEQVFAYLQHHIEPGGTPYAMVICGQTGTWLRAGWQQLGAQEGVMVTYEP